MVYSSTHLLYLDYLENKKRKKVFQKQEKNHEAKQKNMCVSGYMLLKIRVGRSDYFLFFEIILFA